MSAHPQNFRKWIDLKDPEGASLKIGRFNNKLVLVITGVRPRSQKFFQVINDLRFTPSTSGTVLIKAIGLNDRIPLSQFQPVWPDAKFEWMDPSTYTLNLIGIKERIEKRAKARELAKERENAKNEQIQALQEEVSGLLAQSRLLGRNRDGLRVFSGPLGRFHLDGESTITYERDRQGQVEASGWGDPEFLRAATQSDLRECAKGLLRAAERGESYNLNQLLGFGASVLVQQDQAEDAELSVEQQDQLAQAIDAAILEDLLESSDSAGKSWADAAFFQEMIPGRAKLKASPDSTPCLASPIAVQVQRLLGNSRVVHVQGKVPALAYGLLPDSTSVYLSNSETMELARETPNLRPIVEPANSQEVPAEGGYWRVSKDESRDQDAFAQFFDAMEEGAIGVLNASSEDVLASASMFGELVQSVKIPSWLTGDPDPTFLFVMRKTADRQSPGERMLESVAPATISSWGDLKTLVDTTLLSLGREEEANEKIDLKSERTENQLQRPYLAASQIGQASTMVPRNLQASLGFALSRLEEGNGKIDTYVSSELGLDQDALQNRFSPEQVDAIGLAIDRIYSGRGFILGDETGIGKGRTIASLAVWAARQSRRVIFVTDRANLFSDLARDLIDIGEWDRFRPLITNSDGEIINIMGDGELLAKPASQARLRETMQLEPEAIPENIVFTTYSQLSGTGSDKAAWLEKISKDSMLILDEAHIAAGADSNTAKQIETMVDSAWGVLYSSATWAKSYRSLQVYQRAMPLSVNISQVVAALKDDNESFGETFSSMLAMDGALIRREHDLSKIDFVVDIDDAYTERNRVVAGQVAEILSMMAMLSGDINHMLQRLSSEDRNSLTDARDARSEVIHRLSTEANELASRQRELEVSIESERERQAYELKRRSQLLAQADSSLSEQEVSKDQAEQLADFGLSHDMLPHIESEIQRLTRQNEEETSRLGDADLLLLRILRLERAILNRHSLIKNHREDLSDLLQQFQGVGANANQIKSKRTLFSSSFGTGSAIYQVMRRTLAALSVDYTADRAIFHAKAGRRPIIVLEETGEGFVRELINDEIQRVKNDIEEMRQREAAGSLTEEDQVTQEIAKLLDDGVRESEIVRQIRAPNLQDMMRHLVRRLGAVRITEYNVDSDNPDDNQINAQAQGTLYGSLLNVPGIPEKTVEVYQKGIDALNEKISQLPTLALTPFDALRVKMEAAGLRVGEISGRQNSLSPVKEQSFEQDIPTASELLAGALKINRRARKKTDVTRTAHKFNDGSYDAILLNTAAATGISLHASPRFADKRQRVLLEMQTPENTTTRIQLFGRANRFDQVIPPIIAMMNTGLKSEIRATMMANEKLKKLSANVRASKENAALIEDVPDLLNSLGDKVCQEYLLENPGIASRLDIDMNRITSVSGLANALTQRLALLSISDYERVYAGLCDAYADAIAIREISGEGDGSEIMDWKARTLRQDHAWGPTRGAEMLSAFDSPVFQRSIQFTQNYQPLHFDEVTKIISESTQNLIKDPRVKDQHILSAYPTPVGEQAFDSTLSYEERLTDERRHDLWARKVMDSLVMSLGHEALELSVEHEEPLEREWTPLHSDDPLGQSGQEDQAGEEDERNDDELSEAMEPEFSSSSRRLLAALAQNVVQETSSNGSEPSSPTPVVGFASLAAHWVALEARIPTTNTNQRLMALISRSGKTAKAWFLDEEGGAQSWLIDLDAAIKGDHTAMGHAFKPLPRTIGLTDDSWQRKRFNQVWGSIDPSVRLLDTSEIAERAHRILKGKMIIGLPQSKAKTVEEALMMGEHNSVKEAKFRADFAHEVLSKLVPGVEVLIHTEEQAKSWQSFFDQKRMVLARVDLPDPSNEASFSKWKFHLIAPGDEKPTVLSAAMLFKMAGAAPHFRLVTVGRNIFEGNGSAIESVRRLFNTYKKGERTVNKTVLCGNLFQAGQWARSTKRGKPIIYTDESGQSHRAIEVIRNHSLLSNVIDFPKRLYGKQMINDFINMIHDAEHNPNIPLRTFFTSFKSALDSQDLSARNRSAIEKIEIDCSKNVFAWTLLKSEKEKVRRSLRSAIRADKGRWELEHPDQAYPVTYATKSERGSANNSHSRLLFQYPSSAAGRERFFNVLIESQGLELFVTKRSQRDYSMAVTAEQMHYDRLAAPSIEALERKKEEKRRREETLAMLEQARRNVAGGGVEGDDLRGQNAAELHAAEQKEDDRLGSPDQNRGRGDQPVDSDNAEHDNSLAERKPGGCSERLRA